MKIPLISAIQKYAIHDGPGIRTTVFFMGCPLRCHWCHNPETQDARRQMSYDRNRCKGCGKCIRFCNKAAIAIQEGYPVTNMSLCSGCKSCTENCIYGARELIGREFTTEELIKECKKDTIFYEESGGGITLSGGEVMTLDSEYLISVMEPLHREGYHIGIDTCGYAEYEKFERILPYTDFILYDIKGMDEKKHLQYTGVDNKLIKENLIKLNNAGAKLYLRIPLLKGINASVQEMEMILQFIKEEGIHPVQIHLLPYHSMGNSKYERLGIHYDGDAFEAPSEKEMHQYQEVFMKQGYRTILGG